MSLHALSAGRTCPAASLRAGAAAARPAIAARPALPARRSLRAAAAPEDEPAPPAEEAPAAVVKQEDTAAVDDLLNEFVAAEEVEEVSVADAAAEFLSTPTGTFLKIGGAAVLGLSAIVTAVRVYMKYNHPSAKKKRNTDKNKELVLELAKFLPGDRAGLTASKLSMLRMSTGFSPVEVYRKYLWFMLRERKFDQEAVDDMAHLAQTLNLTAEDVGTALTERAERVYKRYGAIMLDTGGMTQEGINRKIAGRALFSKLLYLAECDAILPQGSEKPLADMRDVFGATEDDISRLRIVSLLDVDLGKLDDMASEPEPEPEQPKPAAAEPEA